MSVTPSNPAGASLVIVGAGLAGWTLAREVRARDPERAITLICADAGDFYSKPMLSNALALKKAPAQLIQTAALAQAEKVGVDLRADTSVLSVDRQAQVVHTDRGDVAYSELVLALGADPIRLPTPGMEHVLSVNDWRDYAAFRAALDRAGEGARVAIIGGGLIGSEFANDLAQGGYAVQVIDPGRWPVGNLVTEEQGRALQTALEALGVVFHWDNVAEAITSSGGRYRLTLRSGDTVEADVVLSAVGLRPRTALAQTMGLTVGRGVEVDDHGRTSDPLIFAIGDCAAYQSAAKPEWFDGAARPLPFVLPLMTAAKAVAATLCAQPTPVRFNAMSVRVKTPAHPLTVAA